MTIEPSPSPPDDEHCNHDNPYGGPQASEGEAADIEAFEQRWWVFRFPALIAIGMVRGYQVFLSPLLGKNCRFTPTCSSYFIQAVKKYGLFWGGLKGIWRICRCNPFGGHGEDPP